MIRMIFLLALSAGFLGAAQACTLDPQERPDTVAGYVENGLSCLESLPSAYRYDRGMELAFIKKINAARAKAGLQKLISRVELKPAARFHSLDMAVNKFFGHHALDGRAHAQRIAAFDRTLLTAGSAENLASLPLQCHNGRGTVIECTDRLLARFNADDNAIVEQLHRGLMNSAGHRRNILSPDMTHIEIGIIRRKDAVFVTQLFAKPAGTLSSPAPMRYKAGEALGLTAATRGWNVAGFAVKTPSRAAELDLQQQKIPPALRGDMQISVRGERDGPIKSRPDGQMIRYFEEIYLSGPAITVTPARATKS